MTERVCYGTSKLERKTVEKNRRLQMKNLCLKLSSLIPRDATTNPKDASRQQDNLDEAASYIRMLQERVEELKQKKQMGVASDSCAVQHFEAPIVEIRELEYSTIEILILCAQNKRFVLYEAIKIVEEEGAKVINATSTTVGGNVICTIHSQVTVPRIGLEVSKVSQRLKNLML